MHAPSQQPVALIQKKKQPGPHHKYISPHRMCEYPNKNKSSGHDSARLCPYAHQKHTISFWLLEQKLELAAASWLAHLRGDERDGLGVVEAEAPGEALLREEPGIVQGELLCLPRRQPHPSSPSGPPAPDARTTERRICGRWVRV